MVYSIFVEKMLSYMRNKCDTEYHDLNNFTMKVNQDILDIVSTVNWTVKNIESDNDDCLNCPYNTSHRISKKKLNQHLVSCQRKEEGYAESDTLLPTSCLPFNSPSSLKLDIQLQNAILQGATKQNPTIKIENYECHSWHNLYTGLGERLIPQTSDRLFSDYTPEERKILYEYVVSNTTKINLGHDITDMHKLKSQDKDNKKLSFLELLVQERNLKRRRARHRGIHTNKKSHTEILREVIDQQMEFYVDFINEMKGANRESKTTAADIQTRIIDERTDDASTDIKEFLSPQKRENHFYKESDSRRVTPTSRSDTKYEVHEKRRTHSSSRDRQKRENSSSSHKRKRSRSKERDYDKRNRHRSIRQNYAKDYTDFHKEKSLENNSYFKRNVDHRKNREKLISRMS